MPGLLPDKPVTATRRNPKTLILYGKPKVGKTEILSQLEQCITLDFEFGTETYDMVKMKINGVLGSKIVKNDRGEAISMTLTDFANEIMAYAYQQQAANPGRKPKPPYKYIAVDTVDILETMCIIAATQKYRDSAIGKTFEGNSVLELPKGGGYPYFWEEMTTWINNLGAMCQYLILISHIREKNITKGGIEVTIQDISLMGKLGSLVAASADAIGYLYRDDKPGSPLMVSFSTTETGTMGSRFKRLAGRNFPFRWEEIYLPEEVAVPA